MIAFDTTALNTAALDGGQPITPQVHRHLRHQIIRNVLKPGHRLSEAEFARTLGVSRQPVREAFIKLAAEGLVAVRPQRGTIVTRIAYCAVLDARFMREAIEADVVAILARGTEGATVAALGEEIAAQRALDPGDADGFMHLDDRFHRTLAAAAGKTGAWKLLEGLKSQMDRVRYLAVGRFPVAKLIDQHETLVGAIDSGDAGRADTAIRLHLREVLHDLPLIRAQNPDVFDIPEGMPPEPVNAPIEGRETT